MIRHGKKHAARLIQSRKGAGQPPDDSKTDHDYGNAVAYAIAFLPDQGV